MAARGDVVDRGAGVSEAGEVRLAGLGWDAGWAAALAAAGAPGEPARVVVVYQDRLSLAGAKGGLWGELRGRLRQRQSAEAEATPAVGDWVLARESPGGMAAVEAILPRRTRLCRQAAGRRTEVQVVAANVDVIFVVTSPRGDYSPRRVERYLAAIREGGAAPAVVLNKVDLCDDPGPWLAGLQAVAGGAPVLVTSAASGAGIGALEEHLGPGRTVAFVGSSGVGKSSLTNRLLGREAQAVAPVREEDDKGRHTTTHRELLVLGEGRGVLVDTPGMRELQLWTGEEAVREVFPDVEAVAVRCRFRDCRHRGEPGCAVAEAVAAGALAPARLTALHRLLDEQGAHAERRRGRRR